MDTFIFSDNIGLEKSYEILCKTFDSEAKSKLEVCSILIRHGIIPLLHLRKTAESHRNLYHYQHCWYLSKLPVLLSALLHITHESIVCWEFVLS